MAEYTTYAEPTPVHLNITFESAREAEALYRELRTWTPSGGWTTATEEFFAALEVASKENRI